MVKRDPIEAARELVRLWEVIEPTLPVADGEALRLYEDAAKLTSPLIARALLKAWQPLNPDVSLGYRAVRHSDDPDIQALQRRMSFTEIHALVAFISRVLIASCNPPPDA